MATMDLQHRLQRGKCVTTESFFFDSYVNDGDGDVGGGIPSPATPLVRDKSNKPTPAKHLLNMYSWRGKALVA